MTINVRELYKSCTLVNANYSYVYTTCKTREYICQREGNIVIARSPGIYGSKPSEYEGEVGLRCHKSMATGATAKMVRPRK